jgi:hypothetical protein
MAYAKSAITAQTPKRIIFGAGVYAHNLPWDTVPTPEQVKTGLIGATNGGGKVSIKPNFVNLELDGVLVKVRGMVQKAGETATMETNMAEVSADYIAKTVIGKASETEDGLFDVIDSKAKIEDTDYYTGFGYIGQMLDGRALMVIFKNAMATEGLEFEAKNQEQVTVPTTVECYSDTAEGDDLEKLPYRIYIEKDGEMVPTSINDVGEEEPASGEEEPASGEEDPAATEEPGVE